ncbi:DUF3850 domain-containing protein [Carnobacterium maltaromaticum]|uniref:DUF3850 domain-containing protein n=1 Tax=Carnobacterium maltaromaticum TaxID=2751 RepID=UPI0039BEBB81
MVRDSIIHDLKIVPCYYKEITTYRKTFEIWKKDRAFQVGESPFFIQDQHYNFLLNYFFDKK